MEGLVEDHFDRLSAGSGCRLEDSNIGAWQRCQWSRNLVGDVQHVRTVAPTGGEGEGGGCATPKGFVEITEVRTTSPPPAINGLIRIAHRHHRVVGEQDGEQRALGNARVLIFIQEHHAVRCPDVLADLRMGRDQLQSERNLIRELDDTPQGFRSVVISHQPHHRNQ